MPTMPPTFRPAAQRARAEVNREADQRRGSAASRGYDRRWMAAAKADRQRNSLCAYCALDGRVTAAVLTDHLYPHRWYRLIFWVKHWWVSSCKSCHDEFKQRIERQGKAALDRLAARLGRPILNPTEHPPTGEGGSKV